MTHPPRHIKKPGAPAKSRRRLWTAILFGGLFLAALFSISPYILASAPSEATIRIVAGSDPDVEKALQDTLAKYFDPSYAGRVMQMVKAQNVDLSSRHGAYLIPQGASPVKAARVLTRGAQQPLKITINGFRTPELLAERVSRKMPWTADDMLAAMADSALLASNGLAPGQGMALILDATYDVYWTDSPLRLMERFAKYNSQVWTQERRAKAEALGLSPAQVETLASIVDEETNQNSEKPRIARLYLNRLDKGMKLQADPTVRYALGDFTIKRVTSRHTSVPSPYNTYYVKGLPPGPIRTVSAQSIDAVLDSSPSDDLYMCAREDFSGFHNFAPDYQTHLANARRYQQALDSLNIH